MPWDVFICHASEEKGAVATPLTDALQSVGVSVWIDENQITLGDSLREQIDHGLQYCRFGVIILSKAFFRKQWTKKELGAFFARETADGRKVVLPILYDLSPQELSQYSPLLADKLAGFWSDGVERVAAQIARVVLSKPATEVDVSELRSPVQTPTTRDLESLVFLLSGQGRSCYFVSDDIVLSGDKLSLVLQSQTSEKRAFLSDLTPDRYSCSGKLGVAYGTTAYLASVESVTQRRKDGDEKATLELRLEDSQTGQWEMAFNNYSVDDIATMRARRILLNEKLTARRDGDRGLLESMIMNIHVSGQDNFLDIEESPLPGLYAEVGEERDLFLALCRLLSILCLRLTNTVEYVQTLDMRLVGQHELQVEFVGRRSRMYSNVDPTTITVAGTCSLVTSETPS